MDWKQFFASIVSSLMSLAWPVVVFVMYWLNCRHVDPLAQRLAQMIKAKIPWLGEFEFGPENARDLISGIQPPVADV